MMDQELLNRIGRINRAKGWDKGWSKGGCYLHLEASEFIESLRGKGNDPPTKEAADVLFTLFGMLSYNGIPLIDVLAALEKIIQELESQQA
ncbi:MAG: hypothetical protein A2Y38_08175 [Spirochaetes bacterium GWB1_59_5]|nr:MAG: hypothetical protein A2Y38_08175 [Spirochaetes bacterium GWB1_59_5]